MTIEGNAEEMRISGFADDPNSAETLALSADSLRQHYPQHYPQAQDALGEPLGVREVAELLGCSDWTVRHRHLPHGLPHFRSGPSGKLVFFRRQVIAWILNRQQHASR